jgi:two-component system phosphate regulon response regulator PhoB
MPKILVIEDAPNIQKLARVNLVSSGYQVLVADNGEEGLKLAQQESPGLILFDLMLPGMSGWDVLMTLKADKKLRKIPVIIMTAAITEGEEFRIRSMRTAGHLVKPFGVDEMLSKVKKALGE